MTDETTPPILSDAEMTDRYVKLRDYRSTLKKAFDAQDKLAKDGMEAIQATLLANMNATGIESIKTGEATAYIHRNEFPRVKDWDLLHAYIRETGNLGLLGRTVHRATALEIKDDTGALPPGVEAEVVREIRIRKS